MAAGRYYKREVALVLGAQREWVDRVAGALDETGLLTRSARSARDAEASFDHGVSVVVSEASLAQGDSAEARFVKAMTKKCPVVLVDDAEEDPEHVSELVLGAIA